MDNITLSVRLSQLLQKIFHPWCTGVSLQISLPSFMKSSEFRCLFQNIIESFPDNQIIFVWQVWIFLTIPVAMASIQNMIYEENIFVIFHKL